MNSTTENQNREIFMFQLSRIIFRLSSTISIIFGLATSVKIISQLKSTIGFWPILYRNSKYHTTMFPLPIPIENVILKY